ncbi:carboxypeptidase-like regulatory domain-containing protein [Fibrobacterota bacterium]
MKNKLFLLYAIIALACFICCTLDIAGGSGSEAGEAIGHAVYSSGDPVINGRVIVYRESDSVFSFPTPVDTLVTNSEGYFSFKQDAGSYAIEIRSDAFAAFQKNIQIIAKQKDSLGVIILDSAVTVSGTVQSRGELPVSMWALGTPYSTAVGGAGGFTFQGIPQGNFTLVAQYFDGSYYYYSLGMSVEFSVDLGGKLDTITTERNEIVLDNFDDGDNYCNFKDILGGSMWYANTDSFSVIYPIAEHFADSLVTTQAYKGKSLHVTYSLDSSVTAPWVQVISNIGDESYNFSLLDTISFWAKGDGRIKICVACFNKPNTYKGVNTFLTISNTWTQYKLVPADFPNTTNISGWDELKTMVNRVIFNGVTGSSEFWLDDIRMIGLTFDDLLKD